MSVRFLFVWVSACILSSMAIANEPVSNPKPTIRRAPIVHSLDQRAPVRKKAPSPSPVPPLRILPANRIPADAVIPPATRASKAKASPTAPEVKRDVDPWRFYSYP